MSNTAEAEVVETVQAPVAAVERIGALEAWARDVVVNDAASYEKTVGTLKGIKALNQNIVDWFRDSKAKAHAAWKAVVAQESGLTDRIAGAERVVKSKLVAYQQAEEAKRIAEQRRLQAEADARAAAERAKLLKAAAKLKTEALREERLQQAAAVAAPVVEVAKTTPVVANTALKTVWKASLVSLPELVKAAAAGNQAALSLLSYNESAGNQFARSTKGAVDVPGLRFASEKSLSIGK